MTTATAPPDVLDPARLAALARYSILDTAPESGFDDIAELARAVCETATALVSFVAADRQWFKARIGFEHAATDLDHSVCAHALRGDAHGDLLVIPDLARDPRTEANPLVRSSPGVRFYAGATLRTPEGLALGSLCVLDAQPRPEGLTPLQEATLRALARQVMALLELRQAVRQRDAALHQRRLDERRRELLIETQVAIAAAAGDLGSILDSLVAGAMRAVPAAEGGAIELLEGEALVYQATRGTLAPHRGYRVALGASLSGATLRGGSPLRVGDAMLDPRADRGAVAHLGTRAALLVPVRPAGRPTGVLMLQSATPDAFTERDLESVRLFAATVPLALAEAGQASARREVRESERRHRAIFESVIDYAIVVLDLEGIITNWNEGACRVLGWSVAEARGRHVGLFFTPEDREARIPEAEMSAALLKGRGADERWHLRRDGSRFWANGEMMALRGEDGDGRVSGFVKVLRDRTESRDAQVRVAQSEERYRQLLDLSPAIIWFAASGGAPSFVNQRFYDVTGLHPDAVPAARWFEVLHPDDAEPFAAAWRAAQEADAVLDTAFRLRDAGGGWRWFSCRAAPVRDAEGQLTGWLGSNSDIQERKLAEEEAARLAAIVQQSTDFIGVARPDGDVDFVNEAGRRLIGLADAGTVRATQVIDYFTPASQAVVRDAVLPAVQRDGYWQGELAFRHAETGAAIPVLYNIFPLRDAAGALTGYATVTRDLTAAKAAEAALREQQRDLQVVLDTIPVGIAFATTVPEARIVGGNKRLEQMVGHPMLLSSDAAGHGEWKAFHPDGRRVSGEEFPLVRIIQRNLDRDELECEYERPDGTRWWMHIDGAAIRDADGTLRGSVVAISDNSDRRRADELQFLMNHELSHRLKNILTVVQAITRQSIRSATDLGTLQGTLSDRLAVLGSAHDVLLGGAAERAPLAAVIRGGTGVLGEVAETRLSLDGPELEVGAAAALPLGMMIHELCTNAAKYGALSTPEGRVTITWSVENGTGPALFRLLWCESGGPPVVAPARKGFGSSLITRGLGGLKGGAVTLSYPPAGVQCRVEVPLSELARGETGAARVDSAPARSP